MGRVNFSLRDDLLEAFLGHCKRIAEPLGEKPSFVFRRIFFSVNSLMNAGITLDQIVEGCKLLIDLKRSGCSFARCREKIKEIALVLDKNSFS